MDIHQRDRRHLQQSHVGSPEFLSVLCVQCVFGGRRRTCNTFSTCLPASTGADNGSIRCRDSIRCPFTSKTTPTIGLEKSYLVVEPNPDRENDLQIVGISNPEISPASNFSESPWFRTGGSRPPRLGCVRLSVYSPGRLRLETTHGRSFDLHEGSVRVPVPIRLFEAFQVWHRRAAIKHVAAQSSIAERVVKFFEWSVTPSEFEQLRSFLINSIEVWIGIFDRVVKARHGGTFVFVPPTYKSEQINIKYSLDSTLFSSLLSERCSLDETLRGGSAPDSERFDAAEQTIIADRKLLELEVFLASLASVDGAVIVADDLRILGFGARLHQSRAVSQIKEIEFKQHPGWSGLPEDRRGAQ